MVDSITQSLENQAWITLMANFNIPTPAKEKSILRASRRREQIQLLTPSGSQESTLLSVGAPISREELLSTNDAQVDETSITTRAHTSNGAGYSQPPSPMIPSLHSVSMNGGNNFPLYAGQYEGYQQERWPRPSGQSIISSATSTIRIIQTAESPSIQNAESYSLCDPGLFPTLDQYLSQGD